MTPQPLAEAVAQRLARWADCVELGDRTAFWTLFELLTRESLTYDGDPCVPPFSGICNDGTPWQFCVSLGAATPQIRYLTEVGRPGTQMGERVALARARLVEAFGRLAYPAEATSLLDELLGLLPTDPQKLGGLRSGVWVGVAQDSCGIPRIRV